MNRMGFFVLAVLGISQACHGVAPSPLKYTVQGLGKAALGVACAYAAFSAAVSNRYLPNAKKGNYMLHLVQSCLTNVKNKGAAGITLGAGESYRLNDEAVDTLSLICSTVSGVYLAGKCFTSAYEDFKKARSFETLNSRHVPKGAVTQEVKPK